MTNDDIKGGSLALILLFWGIVIISPVFVLSQPAPSHGYTAPPVAATGTPSFDVVSIRQNLSGKGLSLDYTADGFTATDMPIQAVIVNAYNLRDPELMIGGKLLPGAPSWINAEKYDVRAKVSASDLVAFQKLGPGSQIDQIRLMLQSMLADRFKLKIRREPKSISCYALVVDKGGLKMKESAPATPEMPDGKMISRPGSISAQGVTLSRLIFALSAPLNCPPQDKTGLNAKYDFNLQYSLDEGVGSSYGSPAGVSQAPPSGADSASPSLFTAIREQLGLRLVPASSSVPSIFIEYIEKPSEN